MSAPVYNIEICQGAIYSQEFQILEDDGVTPVNLTGDYIAMEIRQTADAVSSLASASTSVGGITINDAANGKFTVTLLPSDTSAITTSGVYDIERSPGGDTNATVRVVQGRAVLSKEVTLI